MRKVPKVVLDPMLKLRENFNEHATRVFLIEASTNRQCTYSEFYQLASQAARILYAQGIRRHDRIALILSNSSELAALYFGCLFLGAVAVPINPNLHAREVSFILEHSGVKLVVCSPLMRKLVVDSSLAHSVPVLYLCPLHEQAEMKHEANVDWYSFDTAPAPEILAWQPMAGVCGDDLFSITFTSGTTSMPKGVAHKINALIANAMAFNEELGFGVDNRFLHVMPMTYMAGFLNTLLSPFMAGGSVVLAAPFDARSVLRFWQPVIEYRANTFWLAPTMLAALLRIDRNHEAPRYCREHVKTICVGTAPLPLKTKKEFERKYGVELFESYGLSELLLVSGNSKRFPRLDNSVGPVLPEVECRVINQEGQSVASDEDGDICIKTPYIMAGYLNYQTLNPEPINSNDWFPTGDIGHLNADGHLFITARKKDLIIRGGLNISPRAVEEVLLEHEAVAQVAVIGLPHDFYGEEVVAIVKLKAAYALNAIRAALTALCKENLNSASVPTRFLELDEFPASTTGKIQKSKLRELLGAKLSKQKGNKR